jgi:putative phosphonate metabolism protein
MPERFALYYAQSTFDPLWVRAAQWLGRDPAGGIAKAADTPGIDTIHRLAISKSARRYGFHATLKAPMALAPGATASDLEAALARFGATTRPVEIGRLKLAQIDGFLALIPVQQTEALTEAVGDIVAAFDSFRAPLSASDRAKRIASGALNARQIELLDQYGYPYVMEEFRFHMTVTDRLSAADRDPVMAAASNWFAPMLDQAFRLDRIALFHEPEAGAPFVRLADHPLTAEAKVDA